ncbi:hypothetical protein JX265_011026 [Neoarthrinium moseri]|uniref:Histone chaperone domain-containing protein n=1 Tax=Neoarthrinium moseri TaxID=1658444 RepID=A0A9P9WDJ5_9PEZI|nr:uncharacterized protein JN550_009610 [Neoarthrinium moseri]KAI1844132.1 hypothetical protein JX266_009616 [Neoarthrinium moseri]KAI1857996.1 hypothetical protein JX265_011026 [Neoarthrinium moseri]KAI1863290.1 hypothetical protein JN550_009610 [Neoarthrinium moseri]
MSAENGSATIPQDPAQVAEAPAGGKGKGKAAATEEPVDQSMEEDDDDSSDEDEGGDNEAAAEEDDDNMDEIDLNNIVEGGRRTRGKVINWAEAAKDIPAEDDEEDEDDDFEAGGDNDDKMDED